MSKQLTIITPTPQKKAKVSKPVRSGKVKAAAIDRMGGEEQGVVENLIDRFASRIDVTRFKVQLQDTLEMVSESFKATTAKPDGFKMKSISVGLAVSGEGSVGLATVGAEVSIEITFEKE